MFVINPDRYLIPDYRISPFQTTDIAINRNLPESSFADEYFSSRFGTGRFIYTENGRSALKEALGYLGLSRESTVTILTTSGNHYVSSCVTSVVEEFCLWNRQVIPETKGIIVIHEFGYPFEGWRELSHFRVPIIEDCAYSFFSEDQNGLLGANGDFSIFSFPKMFPIQIGGLLVSKTEAKLKTKEWRPNGHSGYVRNVVSHYLKSEKHMIRKRLDNFIFLREAFKELGLEIRFHLKDGVVPGVFMVKLSDENKLKGIREFFSRNGIQSSIFYGENAFFIPCHQNLTEDDLRYFVAATGFYLSTK